MNQEPMNLQTRLSAHFTLGELTRSRSHPEVKNIPSPVQVENLKRVCVWLEALRARYNARYGDGEEPIIITSGYRSVELNRKVGGVATSNHLSGCAVDIRVAGREQLIRYACILLDYADEMQHDVASNRDGSSADFDELLLEHGPNGVIWLHFAVRPPGQPNRRRIRFL